MSEDLGGSGWAQSPLFGSISLQLGEVVDGFAPFCLGLHAPSPAYKPRFGPLLKILPPGTRPGLVGLRGDLAFPKQVYSQRHLSLNSDPYKTSIGIVEVASGEIRGAVLRKFLFQDLMLALLQVEPRTPSDSFAYCAQGAFQLVDGQVALDLNGALVIPYPSGYGFPLPDGGTAVAGEGSRLTPFLRLAAIEAAAFGPAEPGQVLRFGGDRQVRGLSADEVSFEVGCDEGEAKVALTLDDIRVGGRGPLPEEAHSGGRRLVIGGFALEDAPAVYCNYYLTIGEQGVDLQLVSTTEELDLWFRGELLS